MAWAIHLGDGVLQTTGLGDRTLIFKIKISADIPAHTGYYRYLYDGRFGGGSGYLAQNSVGGLVSNSVLNAKINNTSVALIDIFSAVAGDIIEFEAASSFGSFVIGGRLNSIDRLALQIEYIDIYDATTLDFLSRQDATASDHSNTGAQPVLVDTIGGNNAVGVNFPTDGSAWIDLGGGGGVSGGVELNVDEVAFSSSGSATLPQPIGVINFATNEVDFTISASATLPNPSGDIGFDLSQIEFISTGGATLPQPVGEIDFDLLSIDFTANGSATVPFPVGAASFDIALIEFNGAGLSTQPSPSGGVEFDISSIEFIGSGSASLPFPVGGALFEVAQVEFSGTGHATFPQPSGNADFRVDEVGFYATGSATQPDSVGNIAFDIASIEFSAIGSVTGVTLPFGDVILPAYTSNVIILNTPPNLIKL